MDIDTVADLLGVSTRQIRTYVNAGMPAGKDGRKPVFNWRDVLNWYIDYRSALDHGDRPDMRTTAGEDDVEEPTDEPAGKKEDIRSASLRKTRAEADLKELALSEKRGEVIVIADAKVRLDRMMGNLRAKLLSMAPKLASRIDGLKLRTEREAAIKDELENLCREVATGAVVDLPQEAESKAVPEIQAAAEDAGEDGGHIGAWLLEALGEIPIGGVASYNEPVLVGERVCEETRPKTLRAQPLKAMLKEINDSLER